MTETATETPDGAAYHGWAIVELMGHRQTAGRVSEVAMAGAKLLRVDTPGADGGTIATQLYGGAAIYCLTPCTEATALRALNEAYNLPPMVRLAIEKDETSSAPPQLSFGAGAHDE